MSELTPAQEAFLASQRLSGLLREAVEDLSAADINCMPMATYAELTGRKLVIEPVAPPQAQAHSGQDPQTVAEAQPPAHSVEHPGIDLASMDMQTYAHLRAQLGIGRSQKEGHGIFDSVGSRSEAYTNAVRAQSGRTAWNNANVVEPPRLERYVRQEQPPTYQSARERFATPGNVFGS